MHADATVGTFRLEVHLDVQPGEVVAVLGPNGAGKTTLLRCLAGLVDGPPPEARSVGVVFQDHLLFPHLCARDNVGFGVAGSRSRRRAVADEFLDRVGLSARGDARPSELSGGQAQRVALARALAREPDLLLLDEPLAALDARTRNEIRRELHRHLVDFPGIAILVTHDPVDAFALADRIVVLEDGRVTHDGAPAEVAARPRTDYVAELLGTNLVRGVASGGVITTATGRLLAATDEDGPVLAVVPPSAVSLHRGHPEGSPRNVWEGRVTDIDRLVDRVHVRVDGQVPIVAAVTPAAIDDLVLTPGSAVWVAIKATEIAVHPV